MCQKNRGLKAVNIDYKYGYGEDNLGFVFRGLNLEIKKGEFISILGHNGCGKSTLAKHFNAILVPTLGDVYVDNINTKDNDNLYTMRKNVGMVFQNPDNQIVATIVEEDVAFALENLGVDPKDIRREIDIAMKNTGTFDFKNKSVTELSGGQKQRVAIAGVIAMKPSYIILDEPSAMLDPSGRQEVMNTIKFLNQKYNITVVLITHYMEEAAHSNRVIVMNNGQIVMDDKPSIVFSRVEELKRIGLDVPEPTRLIYELRKEGFNLPFDIINEKDCVNAILSLMGV